MPMRVAHVSATFPPYYGGTGNVCYHNARVLAARVHDVHVYTATWPGEPDDPAGVTVHRLSPLARVGNAPVLPSLARLRAFDLVHLHYPYYSGAELVALSRLPYVVTYHQDVAFCGPLGWATRVHGRVLGRHILESAARLCPTSLDYLRHSVFAGLIERMGPRVSELPNGVDTTRFCPGPTDVAARRRWDIPDDALAVLFVGAMDRPHYFKGVPALLDALARVENLFGLFVGGGELVPEYRSRAAACGVADRVRFTGSVPSTDLPDVYRAADLLVLPSVTRGEAFGMVLLESMASGRPVVASDWPGVRTLVSHGDDGLLVPAGDVAALAAAIQRLAAMPREARLAMGAAGRRKVEACYDWDRIGDRLEALYGGVLIDRVAAHAA